MSNPSSIRIRQGYTSASPVPTQVVSNEEFLPPPQSDKQAQVEGLLDLASERLSKKLGMNRRKFLKTTGGMALAFLTMNQVFGKFFDVLASEAAEPQAFQERKGEMPFIFDVQTHYVSSSFNQPGWKDGLLGLRRRAREMGVNPKLSGDRGTMEDLSLENYIKEVFLDSDTSIGLISTPPGPYPWEAVVPPKEMTHIRDEINRLTASQRMLAHGLVMPQLGKVDLDYMDQQAETFKVDAWKCYTGSPPKGFEHGWWLSDEKIAYPMLEKAQALGITNICTHKGLPLGPVAHYNHPRDTLQAAADFPKLNFLIYHSGFLGTSRINIEEAKKGEIPWTTEFCRLKQQQPKLNNIYMELGSTFGQLVITEPVVCAHLLGQILLAFGADHVIWGTDSIWYGTPQWQIEAFRRFQMPDELQEKFRYPALTKDLKAQVFGLNAAKLFHVDIETKRQDVPKDYLNHIKMAYLQEGPTPSHHAYGWVRG
ncbi:MAG: amidohydrolase family protein [Nitrospirales bacterium]|nr:amidohydrolase [Nitrospirales bacterium]